MSMNQPGPSTSHEKCFSLQQALALYLDLDLLENKYLTLSSTLNALHPGLFPGLYKLRQYKKTIVPINIVTTELSAEAHLQDLLNTTIKSIIETVQPRFPRECFQFFNFAFMALKLIDNRNRKQVWKNPSHSSTLFCRPIRFQYIKECKHVVKAEEQRATSDIEKVQQFKVVQSGQERFAKYEIMGHLHCIVGPEALRRISYKLPFKSWQVRGGENKSKLLSRKQEVEKNFKILMGLLIDVPKPGYGTTVAFNKS
nr:unnamed protein product [Callosobruchus analis]